MKKGFAHGAVKLGSAGLLCSAIGSLFRIMLAGCIGTMGIAYYQLAYPIYVLLTVVATSGIPAAISKRVSEFAALGDYRTAHYFFVTCFRTLLLAGLGGSVLLAAGSFWIVRLQVESIRRTRFKTLIMTAHIDKAVEEIERRRETAGRGVEYKAFEMYFMQGMDYAEIAEELDTGKNTPRRWVTGIINELSVLLWGIDEERVK